MKLLSLGFGFIVPETFRRVIVLGDSLESVPLCRIYLGLLISRSREASMQSLVG
jgi:hypothetical protein